MKSVQSQKVQITVKTKNNADIEKEHDLDVNIEESVSTDYTLCNQLEAPEREPSPLWDKNIDDLVNIISNGKSNKNRGNTTSKKKRKVRGKKIQNSPHLSREERKNEFGNLKPAITDIKYWQRFLFESPGSNVEMYNAETEYYIRKLEELAQKCHSSSKVS